MQVNKLPQFTGPARVRCTAATAFEERYPRLRFFNEPEGGAGGDNNSGAGAGSGDPDGDDDKLGEGGKKALESERTARKSAETENADLKAKLKEFEDGKLTADQKLQRDAEESKTKVGQLEADNGKLTLENGRLRAALTEGLPVDWADRVRGETDEEMLADAKKIKASLRGSGEGDYTPGAGARGSDVKNDSAPGVDRMRNAYAANDKK
ncbi:hypothetical protein CH296_11190 [Rhodococcus sp. 14-2496-1d]|uniref:hypothetical protein n=1 Tax=Rhodococcus sp. 14-2496-1d TaxID=2023146 RepID=UPI000B9BB718|nr:hypothetical protein [Rhodococcus sp. 14-2496-1d]OZF33192.1 hypothetical protein CH296_11190 [Rhodococcus sp. 14-2496-1d]